MLVVRMKFNHNMPQLTRSQSLSILETWDNMMEEAQLCPKITEKILHHHSSEPIYILI